MYLYMQNIYIYTAPIGVLLPCNPNPPIPTPIQHTANTATSTAIAHRLQRLQDFAYDAETIADLLRTAQDDLQPSLTDTTTQRTTYTIYFDDKIRMPTLDPNN